MKRRLFLQGVGGAALTAAAATFPAPGLLRRARAADTVKLGCLFSSSGAMANIEGRLNDVARMAAAELNAKGGVLGRTVEVVSTDPGSDWPLYADFVEELRSEVERAGCDDRLTRRPDLTPGLAPSIARSVWRAS